jgi:hypothetical protein
LIKTLAYRFSFFLSSGPVRPVSPRKAVDGFGSGSGSGSGFDSGISTGYGSADLYEVIDVSEGSTSPKKRHIKY